MNTDLILGFAMLFAATIALYCAIVYAINAIKKRKALEAANQQVEQPSY